MKSKYTEIQMKEPMKNHRYQVLMCLLLTLACSLRAADTVYVGVDYGLLRSTDAGATWEMVDVPLNTPFMKGYVRPGFLAMDPHNTSKIYFIGFAGAASSFFASADAGASWTQLPTPATAAEPSGSTVNQVFADPAVSGTVYALSDNGTYVFKSA